MSKSRRYDLSVFTLFIFSSLIFSPYTPLASASSSTSSSSLHRRDPLQHFKYYNGSFDLRSKHYWASTAFTGVHGYAMAATWFVCGLGFGVFLMLRHFYSCNKSGSSSSVVWTNHSDFYHYSLFLVIVVFLVLAMVATGFVIAENQRTLHRTKKLKETILGAGAQARRTIHKVNKVMNNIETLLCPYDQTTCTLLNDTSHQLGRESHTIRNFIQKNGHSIDKAIWSSYIANLVVVTVNLFFLLTGLVMILIHWHPGFIIIIFLCWILTMACWVLSGIDYFVHNFAEDTCTALQEFEENPVNSSLSSLLPCADALKSQSVMVKFGETVHNFITELNMNINVVPKELGLNDAKYGDVLGDRKICDPFSGPPDYTYLEGKCPKNAIPIRDLPDILARFTCNGGMTVEDCKGNGKFLPEQTYLMANAYIRSIQHLIDIYPDMENLIRCSFVKDRIFDVVLHQCKPFRLSTYLLWVSILCLSIDMMILVLLWITKAYQDRGRSFSWCSIIPRHEQI